MSRKRPRFRKDGVPEYGESEEKEQSKEEYDAFKFMKSKKQAVGIAGVFFLVGFLASWFVQPSMTGMVVSSGVAVNADEVGQSGVDFLNEYFVDGGGVSLVSAEDTGSLIEVTTEYNGNEIPIQMTKDGKFIILGGVGAVNMDEYREQASQEPDAPEPAPDAGVPKTEKPIVDLFIWSYCPYGVAAQGPLSEVASLFGDKAEFNAVLYYDGHGAYETQQNKIQACIQKVDKDKYWDYAKGFVEEIYPVCGASRDIDCDKTESVSLMDSLGIDSSAVIDCVDDEGADLIAEDSQYARSLGVTGSPTIAINGVVTRPPSRTAEAFKSSVCQAFNDLPEECSAQLDSTAAAAQGNC